MPPTGCSTWARERDESGGRLMYSGPPGSIDGSLTGRYLRGELAVAVPAERRPARGHLRVLGARAHNLRDVDAEVPLGALTAVTGVSGSGKSTLVEDVLHRALAQRLYRASAEPGRHRALEGAEAIDKVIAIDQSPIGRTPRSNPATYTGAFALIRELFSLVPEARARGYKPGRFSFNVKGGRCEGCQGDGVRRVEMHFLPDVFVPCEACHGRRYNRETLEVRYQGLSIADVLDLSVDAARERLGAHARLSRLLATLSEVGLGYLRLGQNAATLSGGEAQRVRLARELGRRETGRTLYLLDEPTTGLHFDDVRRLLGGARAPRRRGKHGRRDRAQPRRDQERGLGDRPRTRRRRRRRPRGGLRDSRNRGPVAEEPHRTLPEAAARPARALTPWLGSHAQSGLVVQEPHAGRDHPPTCDDVTPSKQTEFVSRRALARGLLS